MNASLDFETINIADLFKLGYIGGGTVAALKEEMKKELEKKVRSIHKLPIREVLIDKRGDGKKEKFYLTTAKWTKSGHIRKKSYDDVITALAEHYGIIDSKCSTYTFGALFVAALDEKQAEEFIDEDTVTDYYNSFKSYISSEFSKKTITSFDASFLNRYSKELIVNKNLKEKAFLKYKGLLNLTFGYAIKHDIITDNPVIKMTDTANLTKGCAKSNAEIKIFTPDEIKRITEEITKRASMRKYTQNDGYYVNGFIMLLASETGMRCAELCALKWSDIGETCIRIHAQQLHKKSGYIYAEYTKDDKKHKACGRIFPLFDGVVRVLNLIKEEQERLGIVSEFVFCHIDGSWIKYEAYQSALRRLCRSLGITATNNHSFRKYFNSYVLIPAGYTLTERAQMLGHSPETNLKYYTLCPMITDNSNRALINRMRAFEDSGKQSGNQIGNQILTENVVLFEKERSLRTANS